MSQPISSYINHNPHIMETIHSEISDDTLINI